MIPRKYQAARMALATGKPYSMRVFGNSMLPKIKSGSTLTFERADEYEVGDIVFCKVGARYIDAHLITAKAGDEDHRRYQISNNHGLINGWTSTVFGRVTKIIAPSGAVREVA